MLAVKIYTVAIKTAINKNYFLKIYIHIVILVSLIATYFFVFSLTKANFNELCKKYLYMYTDYYCKFRF